MKLLSMLAATLIMGLGAQAHAADAPAPIRGINYDPAHSIFFTAAQAANDIDTMRQSIQKDLAQIKKMNFNVIKTFYATFCTQNGQKCQDIVPLAKNAKLQVLLGVYEFDIAAWTQVQVEAAIKSTNANPDSVVGVVVGNEDAFTYDGKPITARQQRIAADMKTIKQALGKTIPVCTAQRQPDWVRLSQKGADPYNLIGISDQICANIYPFWGNSPEKIKNVSVAISVIPDAVADLEKLFPGKPVVVTEEGWPSCGANPRTQDKNIASEADYFHSWLTRSVNFSSYLFSAYDNNIAPICTPTSPVGDANNYFGLCTALGQTKSKTIITC